MNPKKLKRRKRTLAAGLALMMAVPMAGYAGVPTVQAEGNQFTVIDIDAIDESYQNQTLPAGSAESDIQFPQKLGITYNEAMDIQITGQNTTANDGGTPGTGDDAGTSDGGPAVQEAAPTQEAVPAEEAVPTQKAVPSEEDIPSEESGPVEESTPVEEEIPVDEEPLPEEENENVVASIASMVKNVFKNIMPQPLVVMAAGEHYVEMDVTWKEVDNKTFTSNGGETFTYEAILPNEYNGNTLVLGAVSLPQINVSIEANTNKTDMKLSFDKSEVTMFAGGASPENNLSGIMENAVVTYSSSNTSIANVDANGTVTATGKGDVTITATAGETANYNSASADYTIHVMDPKEGYRVTATGWSNEDFGIVAVNNKYWIRETPTGPKASGINYGADKGKVESGVAEFYVYYEPTDTLSGKLTEEYYVDKEAPTGTIVIGNKTWDAVQTDNSQATYTVEKPIEVTINAADNGSGIKSVEYYTRGTMHWGENQLELMATVTGGWKTYSENAKPVLNARGGELVEYVYVKITDNVGNVTYLSSGPIKVLGDATTNTPTTTPEEETNTPVSEIKIDSVNVKSVSTNKAKVQVTASGNGTINEYYLFWTQTEGTYDAEAVKANGVMQAKGDFSISGLSPDTKYYVYAFAKDTDGNETAVSAASFTTDAKKAGHSSSGSSSGSEDSAADSTPAAASADPGAAAVTAVTPVSTGDTQHIMPYMLMGASALAGLAVITLYFKKSKEK